MCTLVSRLQRSDLSQMASEHLLSGVSKPEEAPRQASAAVRRLRAWVLQQSHFSCSTSHHFLLALLRAAQLDEERAKQILQQQATVRTTPPFSHVFHHWSALEPSAELALQTGVVTMLPGVARDGSRVMILRTGLIHRYPSHSNKVTLRDVQKAVTISIDVLMDDPVLQTRGLSLVSDQENTGWRDFLRYTMPIAKQISTVLTVDTPRKITCIKLLNASLMTQGTVGVLRSVVRNNPATLCECLDTDELDVYFQSLPTEVGGSAGSYEALTANWNSFVNSRVPELHWLRHFHSQPQEETK